MKILVLAPHTDDGQFGCGGTIPKMTEEGHEVREAAFSFTDTLGDEWQAAMKNAGVGKSYPFVLPVRYFHERRQDVLNHMIGIRDEYDPDLVFCPSSFDTHQDHEVVRQEAFRAFKHTSILGYELPWNNIDFRATYFVELSIKNMLRKKGACACYASQAKRSYTSPVYIAAWARSRGAQIGVEFAEAFEVIRLIQ